MTPQELVAAFDRAFERMGNGQLRVVEEQRTGGLVTLIEASDGEGNFLPIATFNKEASRDEIELMELFCHEGRALFDLLKKTGARYAEMRDHLRAQRAAANQQPPEKPTKNYAAQCAKLCEDERFWQFLGIDSTGVQMPKQAAAQRVRYRLGIESRKALNDDKAAAQKWLSMVRQFERWLCDRGAAA